MIPLRLLRNGAFAVASMLLVSGCADGTNTWVGRGVGFRDIPIELWAGAPLDSVVSDSDILPTVDTLTGNRQNRTISGPTIWTHPETGETLWVYERTNFRSDGVKRQLFAMRPDGEALARVFDARPGQANRTFSGDAFFPLGTWRQGEERSFRMVEFTAEGPKERIATIEIREIDYTYRDVPHSLKFDWILTDAEGNVVYHENYIYSPDRSMVRFRNRL